MALLLFLKVNPIIRRADHNPTNSLNSTQPTATISPTVLHKRSFHKFPRYLLLNGDQANNLDLQTSSRHRPSALAALAVLAIFWLWGHIDNQLTTYYASKYRPATIPNGYAPKHIPSRDVSVISCAITPEPTFLACLKRWLQNNPLEVVIATRPKHKQAFDSVLASASFDTTNVCILAADENEYPGYRGQLVCAISQAKGSILAKVDGHVGWGEAYLENMLPAFEDPKGCCAGGGLAVNIPAERQNPEVTTPWEVAAAKTLHNDTHTNPDVYVAGMVPGYWAFFNEYPYMKRY